MARSTLSRYLEPLSAVLWAGLLVWSAFAVVLSVTGFSLDWLHNTFRDPGLRSTVRAFALSTMAVWLALAAVNTHLAYSRSEGLNVARRWMLILLGGSMLVGFVLIHPLLFPGPLFFMDSLGPQLAGLPICWALLWYVLVTGARETVLWIRPRASHAVTTISGAVLATLTIVLLHPVVSISTGVWRFWLLPKGGAWMGLGIVFVLALGLSWLLMEPLGSSRNRWKSRKPAVAWLILLVIALLAYLGPR